MQKVDTVIFIVIIVISEYVYMNQSEKKNLWKDIFQLVK